MKERPILMRDEMVRAILDGRKTQTRSIVNPQPSNLKEGWYPDRYNKTAEWTFWGPRKTDQSGRCTLPFFRCKYGVPGDRMWVKETWAAMVGGPVTKENAVIYRASDDGKWLWRPSIFMPRWASRITLEIVAVRVERLQDITEEDAKAEGVDEEKYAVRYYCDEGDPNDPNDFGQHRCNWRFGYKMLWDSINDKTHPWSSNPWVFVIEFQRV